MAWGWGPLVCRPRMPQAVWYGRHKSQTPFPAPAPHSSSSGRFSPQSTFNNDPQGYRRCVWYSPEVLISSRSTSRVSDLRVRFPVTNFDHVSRACADAATMVEAGVGERLDNLLLEILDGYDQLQMYYKGLAKHTNSVCAELRESGGFALSQCRGMCGSRVRSISAAGPHEHRAGAALQGPHDCGRAAVPRQHVADPQGRNVCV